jgi:hypothetical protein
MAMVATMKEEKINPMPKPNRKIRLVNTPNIVAPEGIANSITRSVFISVKKA